MSKRFNNPHEPTCHEVEQLLEALLEGRLGTADRTGVETHLASCTACRDLAEVAHVFAAAPSRPQAPNLTATVLARTVGDPCARARDLLCERLDGALDSIDDELLDAHATRCADCGHIAAVLETLSVEMRQMAVVEPDPRFVRDVMRATLGPDARWRLLAARASRGWTRIVTRPRFGLEAAYVGAMLLFALFGLPFSPLHDMPAQALAFTERGSLAVVNYSNAVGRIPDQVATLGGIAWDATGAHGVDSVRDMRRNLSTRYDRTTPAREALREDGDRLREAARSGDLPQSGKAIQDIGTDLGEFVRLISVTPPPPTDNDTRPPGNGRG